jgi:beta-lactamase class A
MQKPATELTRRDLTRGLLALPMLFAARGVRAEASPTAVSDAVSALEQAHGGRLGVAILNTNTGDLVGHRVDERFAMCSTFKLLLSGCVLARADRGEEPLDRVVRVRRRHLIQHSPVLGERVGDDLSLAELCHATMTTSDNAAANLLLARVGGPDGLTAYLRSLGDTVTRVDRIEPEMNRVDINNGDTRDTTTPAAMASTAAALTGLTRLRANLPADWNAGDKTGTGGDGPTNDVAVGWPPGRGAVVVAAYYDRTGRTMDENAVVLADVGKIVASLV